MNCSNCSELDRFVWFKVQLLSLEDNIFLLGQHWSWVQLAVRGLPLCFCPCPSASFTLKIWPLGSHESQTGMGISMFFRFYVLVHLWCLCPCVSWFPGNLRHLRRCFFKGSSQDTNVRIQLWEAALEYEVTQLPVPVYNAQTGLWFVLWNNASWDDKNFQLPAAKIDI